MKGQEMKLELIDRNTLIKHIEYQAHIGGKERLLSEAEVIAMIKLCTVWGEKTIVRY